MNCSVFYDMFLQNPYRFEATGGKEVSELFEWFTNQNDFVPTLEDCYLDKHDDGTNGFRFGCHTKKEATAIRKKMDELSMPRLARWLS